ncbi:MAG: ROK family protein [Candidatus Bathyarchaeota archaeon]|nr:ROK family protein [Candidatus Bathyarchaeota archaeon]
MRKNLVTLGVDLGGTKVKTAMVDIQGRILYSHKNLTHPEKGPDQIIMDMIACINECQRKAGEKADGIGVGIAGQVSESGVVHFAPNLKWWDFPLRNKLEENLQIPVFVVNDVRAATWGEWRYGSGEGVSDVVVLFLGTGIGGGVITGGKILQGCSNAAGELGHITIVVEGRRCRCRNKGCLEAYAGGWAIAERAQEMVRSNPTAGQHLIQLAGSVYNISTATVSQAFKEKDSLATSIVEKTGQYLSAGLVGIINAFNPCVLVLGGGVIEGIPELVTITQKNIKERALEAAIKKLKIKKSALGENAGIIGAATLAQDQIRG